MDERWLPAGAVAVIGLLLAAVQVAHAIQQTDVAVAVVDAVPFAAMGLAVAFAGFWIARDRATDGRAARIALWSVGGMIAMAAVSALVLFSQRVTTGTLARATYLTMDLVTVGALGGVLVGLYDARSQRRRKEVATERDRIEAFAGKVADVNNYGRALYGAESVDGVAAYVAQAVESLVGLHETAIGRVSDGGVDLVANTSRVDEALVADLAREASAGRSRDVVVRDDLADEVPGDVSSVVTALVHEGAEGAIVVVALGAADVPVREMDRQLLELVIAHAAATLRRIDGSADTRA